MANVENQKSITETLRERVRKKLKAVKVINYLDQTCNLLFKLYMKPNIFPFVLWKAENLVSLEDSTSIPHRVEFLEKKKLGTRYVKAVS